MSLIITPKNKPEEKVVRAFLSSLNIGFYSEAEEEAALANAMQKGRKTSLLDKTEKADFLQAVKAGKVNIEIRKSFQKDALKIL